MINLSDSRARKIYRDWYIVIGISVVLLGFCNWILGLGVSNDIHSLAFIVASGLTALMIGFLAVNRDLRCSVATPVGYHKGRVDDR